MRPLAIVVQCFAKPDTLQSTCDSLLRCEGIDAADLIFWSDTPIGSRWEQRFTAAAQEVQAYLDRFVAQAGHCFKSVSRHANATNLGTCKTCETALDWAFARHEFAVFAEDDVIFARDALAWFDATRPLLCDGEAGTVWAIAGESIFFDARDKPIPPDWPRAMRQLASDEGLPKFYTTHSFIPSTCFATNRAAWAQFGQTRGQPQGDVDLCRRCEAEGFQAIFPVVPRVKDIGMLHVNGYSVLIHSRDNVSEIKNTYVMSDDLIAPGPGAPRSFAPYDGHRGRLYTLTTLMQHA